MVVVEAEPGVPVAEAIERLRAELEAALAAGVGRRVQFGVGDVTLTVSVVAGRTRDASGKLRWWLVEAGGGGSKTSQNVQTLVLTLRPQLVDERGVRSDLYVAADDFNEADDMDTDVSRP